MTEKQLFGRIQHKYDTEANWNKATSFIPKKGELIIYSDLERFKIGDGSSKLSALRFYDESLRELINDLAFDWNASEGEVGYIKNRTHYIGKEKVDILSATALPYDGAGYFVLSTSLNLEAGKEYTVIWNSDTYSVTAQEVSWPDSGIGLGNCSQMGGTGNNEPFGISYSDDTLFCIPYDGLISATLTIQGDSFVYHRLAKDFLPEDVVYSEELTAGLSGKVDVVSGKGLSTNDYTTADKEKVSTIDSKSSVQFVIWGDDD